MVRTSMGLAALLASLTAAGAAQADARTYIGPHPLDFQGNWDFEAGAHVHENLPIGTGPFGEVEGALIFLADPLAWGYQRTVWTYRGTHPLPGGVQAYCDVTGDHRHVFAPEGAYQVEDSGVYVYAGALRGGVAMIRPRRPAPARPVTTARRARSRVVPYGGYGYYGVPRGAMRRAPARSRSGSPQAPLPSPLDSRYSRMRSHPRRAAPRVEQGRGQGRQHP